MTQAAAATTRRRSAAWVARPAALALLVLLAVTVPAAPASAATTVYRSVDADGRVIYSDKPPAPGESAETVEIRNPESFEAPAPTPGEAAGETWDWDMTRGDEAPEAFSYGAITVLSPANDEGVRDNSGTVTVVADVEPGLRQGHTIEVLMDGQAVATAGGSQVTLTEVERGTHTLLVRVIDETGAIMIESQPSTFHMLRYTPLTAPNRPKPKPHGR